MTKLEEPTITKNDRGEDVYSHPAYGQISITRPQGGKTGLYGSEFAHNSLIAIKIEKSEMHRHLSRDWHHARETIAEVYLSEAQWATFVSSVGQSGGVPATIHFSEGDGLRPRIPVRTTTGLYQKETDERLAKAVSRIDDLIRKIEEGTSGMSKKKADELLSFAQSSRQELASNIDYVSDSFGKHMETIVEKAKVEINAAVMSAVQRAGLDSLGAPASLTLGIEDQREKVEADDAA